MAPGEDGSQLLGEASQAQPRRSASTADVRQECPEAVAAHPRNGIGQSVPVANAFGSHSAHLEF